MKQSIMIEPGKIEFRQVKKPPITDHEVLMQTKRIGICGSDIHVFHGLHPYTSYPIVQGHEVAGVVAEVGKAVEGIAVGDKVTFTPQVVCGECYPCRHGMYHICETLKVMGFFTPGGRPSDARLSRTGRIDLMVETEDGADRPAVSTTWEVRGPF